jgi:acetoin utilization deacetylase AcuC-like enzyme
LRRLYYCDHYEFPLPPGHRFPTRKYQLTRDLLATDFQFIAAPLAPIEIVALAHDPAYVQEFTNGTIGAAAMRRIGFPWSEGLVQRTLASVGGTLKATEDAFSSGWGGNLAGGTHHASRSEGAGFCVFNDMAVAIRYFRPGRAAVLDLDVHQGDGTARIFAGDASVLAASVHCAANFPFHKQTGAIDVSLPPGTRDPEYLGAVGEIIRQVFDWRPEILFYQSGVDGLEEDSLGHFSLTQTGLLERDQLVFEACRTHRVPVVITLGGGYADPIELTAEAHTGTFRTAARVLG